MTARHAMARRGLACLVEARLGRGGVVRCRPCSAASAGRDDPLRRKVS